METDSIVKLPTTVRFSPWALSARAAASRHTSPHHHRLLRSRAFGVWRR